MVGRGVSKLDPAMLASECENTPKNTFAHLNTRVRMGVSVMVREGAGEGENEGECDGDG